MYGARKGHIGFGLVSEQGRTPGPSRTRDTFSTQVRPLPSLSGPRTRTPCSHWGREVPSFSPPLSSLTIRLPSRRGTSDVFPCTYTQPRLQRGSLTMRSITRSLKLKVVNEQAEKMRDLLRDTLRTKGVTGRTSSYCFHTTTWFHFGRTWSLCLSCLCVDGDHFTSTSGDNVVSLSDGRQTKVQKG